VKRPTRRRHIRASVELAVEYRTAGGFLVSYSTDLSYGGVFVETPSPLEQGTSVTLRMHVPGLGEPLETEATVAWVRSKTTAEGSAPGMGLEFAALEVAFGEAIDRLVEGFGRLRVALLGGNPETRALLSRYLRGVFSCDVLDAIPQQNEGPPCDLVVADLNAIEEGGLWLLERCRSDWGIPVAAVSRSGELRDRARRAGAAEVLPSPPAFTDFQSSVLRAVSRPTVVVHA